MDRYRVNDVLTALAAEMGSELDDDTLNDLTHHVANVVEAGTCGEHAGTGWPCPTCDICERSSCFTEDMEWNGETGNHVECEARQRPGEFRNQFAPEPSDGHTEVNVVRIPSEDGAEYDLYLVPPEGTTPEDAVKIADEAVEAYFESNGDLELFPHLIDKGFGFLNIYTTEGTW